MPRNREYTAARQSVHLTLRSIAAVLVLAGTMPAFGQNQRGAVAELGREAAGATPYRVIENVSFGKEAPEAQVLCAHLVKSEKPTPVLVQINSGGWNSSPPRAVVTPLMQPYLDAGISIVNVAHRPVDAKVAWPVPADDVARGIQYIRAHAAEWGIDPARIALKGRSSGGHVALMVGFEPDRAKPGSSDPIERQSSRPNCIMAGAAPSDLPLQMREVLSAEKSGGLRKRVQYLVGAGDKEISLDEIVARLKPLSPTEIVKPDAPPVYLLNRGPADAFWPGDTRLKWEAHTPITSLIMAKKLKELGVPYELVILPIDSKSIEPSDQEWAFLRKYLGVTRAPAAEPAR